MSDGRRTRATVRHGLPEAIGPVLQRVIVETGLAGRLEERRLLEAWPEIVGERVARHSRPLDLNEGVLTLEADNAVWRQELTLMAPLIVRRYNELCGEGTVLEINWHRGQARSRRDAHRR